MDELRRRLLEKGGPQAAALLDEILKLSPEEREGRIIWDIARLKAPIDIQVDLLSALGQRGNQR